MRTAETGLVLVQELINTRATPGTPDLLTQRRSAQAWWDHSVQQWAAMRDVTVPSTKLSDDDLVTLRQLRTTFAELIANGRVPSDTPSVTVAITPGQDGLVRPIPSGEGPAWLAAALWSEVLLAQENQTWSRLKLCRNVDCSTAFYDASSNRSAVWHDATTCGNMINLRAARARRRGRSAT